MKTFKIIPVGGIGDALLLTPVIRTLKTRNPSCRIKVLCHNREKYELYRHNPYIDSLRVPRYAPLDAAAVLLKMFRKQLMDPEKRGDYIFPNWGMFCPIVFDIGHASDIMAAIAGIELDDRHIDVFLTDAEVRQGSAVMAQYRNPVVIQTTAASMRPNKSWHARNWEQLVSRNPHFTFIQLGLKTDEKVVGAVDCRGTTSVREAIAMLKHARAFVGIDSFLGNATNAVNVPGVVLFGPTPPHVVSQPNNIAVTGSLPPCAPCSEVGLLGGAPCPYGAPCMSSISVEAVERALRIQAEKTSHRGAC